MAKKDAPKSKSKSDKPKKPLKGFMLFSKEMRPKVKEDFPDLTFGGIGKKLGELWRELDDEAKEKYKEPAE